ncbi:hypothetical protein L2E82_22791 [Cichorium intybus]|uniref:Uncharacterized protein n=1 Tax=Cichorium intybus TaxID=13427 RepID=A0ACB9DZ18_CICIN|nr:hypothetical protein L2E82_22791 [Cichorium intybus]
MKKTYLRRHDCCDQELLNIIENRRSEDLVEDKVKSEPTLGSDHSRREVFGCKGDGAVLPIERECSSSLKVRYGFQVGNRVVVIRQSLDWKRFNPLVGLLLCPVASKALASKGLVGPLLSS